MNKTIMNKTMKIALCIGLTGLGMFVWTHFAAAKGKPAPAIVVTTFLAGDVVAEPQNSIHVPFTATIDFTKYIPYICPDSVAGEELLNMLKSMNPITYDSLVMLVKETSMQRSYLNFTKTIDGVAYTIVLDQFVSGSKILTAPKLYTITLNEGMFSIRKGKNTVLTAGACVGGKNVVNVTYTVLMP